MDIPKEIFFKKDYVYYDIQENDIFKIEDITYSDILPIKVKYMDDQKDSWMLSAGWLPYTGIEIIELGFGECSDYPEHLL